MKKIISFEEDLLKESTKEIVEYVPPKQRNIKGRKYNAKDRMQYGPYLEKMFYENELARYEKKQRTNAQLKTDFLRDHDNHYYLKKRFITFKETIGNYRTRYNKRKLYAAQEPVYLLSFQYDEYGIIVVDGKRYYEYLSFEQAYARCIEFKVADPRFVPHGLIKRIRDRITSKDPEFLQWSVPTDKWIRSFENKIGKNAYNSVHFPAGWQREDTEETDEDYSYYSDE